MFESEVVLPSAALVSPNRGYDILSYEGWVYCARTEGKNIFLAYFEKGRPREIRGARLNSVHRGQGFNPRSGTWIDAVDGKWMASKIGIIKLPDFPADEDWGLKSVYEGPQPGKAKK